MLKSTVSSGKAAIGLAIFILPLVGVSAARAAPLYTVLGLGTLNGIGSDGDAINSAGQVTGYSDKTNIGADAFLWTPGGTSGAAGNPQMLDLGTLGGNGSYSAGINDGGQVTGDSWTSGQIARHAFLWTPGGTAGVMTNPQMLDLGTLGGATSFAGGISRSDQVVGESATSSGAYDAFLWTAGGTTGAATNPQMQDLGSLSPGGGGVASAINNLGQITGSAYLSTGYAHAFLWTPGGTSGVATNPQMQDLGTLGGNTSQANGINGAGDVVGYSQLSGGAERAFIWTSTGGLRNIGTLGGNASYAYGINHSGNVVGFHQTATGGPRAFLWTTRAGMQDLNNLIPSGSGWTIETVRSINGSGEIAGTGIGPGGAPEALLLTPVPGTDSVTPMYDAQAVSSNGVGFVINSVSSASSIYAVKYTSPVSEQRGVAEFNLGGIPKGAKITSATLRLDVNDVTTGASNNPAIAIYGYAGSGSPNPTAVNNLANLIGNSGAITQLGELDVTLNTTYIQSLLDGGNGDLGLIEVANVANLQTGFVSNEMAGAYGGVSPTLVVTYATPEPATLSVLALGVLSLGCRRWRKRWIV